MAADDSAAATEPLFLEPSDGVGLVTPEPSPRDVRVLLSPLLQDGMGDYAVGITTVPPGVVGTLHSHPETAEVWMIVEGNGLARVGDQERPVTSGSIVYTPPGVPHQFINRSDAPVKLFWLYSPSGGEQAVIDAEFR